MMDALLLVLGLVVLIKGADFSWAFAVFAMFGIKALY